MNRSFVPVIVTIIVLLVSLTCYGEIKQPINTLDIRLARDLYAIEKYRANPVHANKQRLKSLHLPIDSDPLLSVYLHLQDPPDTKITVQLQEFTHKIYPHAWLPAVGAHKTGCLLAEIRSSSIRSLLEAGQVVRITAAYRELSPQNDLSAIETSAAEAWEREPSLTGEDIRLAILDSGFQLDHPDLPAPAASMDYADYPDTNEDVTDLNNAHGTHVAGTSFGSGALSGGRFMGMAPDAQPIYFKIGNDSNASASVKAVVGAVTGTVWAEADIANMSYGGFDGFNDGSSVEEQAVDWAVSQGVSIFMSAGNSTQRQYHYQGMVSAGQTVDRIHMFSRSSPRDEIWNLQLGWYDGADTSLHRDLSAVISDSEGEEIWYDEIEWITSPRGTEARLYQGVEPLPEDSISFFISVSNHSDVDQEFHLIVYSEYNRLRFQRYGSGYLVLQPSTADSCISVAAYVTRPSWTNYLGEFYDSGVEPGERAGFSAIGPRIDGVMKPDIAAPGQRTISCRDQNIVRMNGSLVAYIISNEGETGEPADYLALQGTSMSSPAAAGVAALILQSAPDMSPSELRQMIFQGARRDEYTGNTPNISWGWGKIDVISALDVPYRGEDLVSIPVSLQITRVFPNPFNDAFEVDFSTISSEPLQVAIFDHTGREIFRQKLEASQPGRHRWVSGDFFRGNPSGIYYIRINNRMESAISKAVYLK